MRVQRVYIVDDESALRRSIRRMLAGVDAEVEEFECAESFLDGYPERPPGCVLLDVKLPGMNGLDLLQQIATFPPRNPVIMLSGFGDIPTAVKAMTVGALDFLQKPFRKEQLLEVVHRGLKTIAVQVHEQQAFEVLTPRERSVLQAFNSGAPNKVVAFELGLSPRTIEMHRARIFKKLGVTNLSQALLRAREVNF